MKRRSQPILTKRLRILALKESGLFGLTPILSDPLVNQFIPYEPWGSELDAQTWFQTTTARIEDGRAAQYVIQRNASKALIGTCLYFKHDAQKASAEYGYVLGQAYWKQGYMFEAMTAFVDHIVAELNLTSLNAMIEKKSVASLNLLAKLGFKKGRLVIEDGNELQTLEKCFTAIA